MTPIDVVGVLVILALAIFGIILRIMANRSSVSGTPPAAVPTPAFADAIAKMIYYYSTGHSFFDKGSVYTVEAKGVIIHALTVTQSNAISAAAQAICKATSWPLTYLLACLGVESVLDPGCVNQNVGPGESNAGNKLGAAGYDVGIAQLKLGELLGQPGISGAADAMAFALDLTKAIPYHVRLMMSKLDYAKEVIAKNTSSAPDPRMNNPYMLATWCYNEGNTGAMTDYANGTFPTHCASVLADEQYFASKLGLKSIFADLAQ